jgi:branched-chain amino acid transport system substrate-binding protein
VLKKRAAAALLCTLPLAAEAQVKIGHMVSATGTTSSIGIPQRNTAALLPARIGETPIDYIQLEDCGDTAQAVHMDERARVLVTVKDGRVRLLAE